MTETQTDTQTARFHVPCYKRSGVTFTHGRGACLYDAGGKRYLDLLSGIGVNALGHAHPRLTRALKEQIDALIHVSNLYEHPLQNECARRIAEACGLDLVFFCNSGTEAIEAGIKLARRYHKERGDAERTRLLALEQSFHGRTLGALSCTWEASYRAPFAPLIPDVDFVPANESAALERALRTRRYALLLMEPIQGESGVLPLERGFLAAARDLTRDSGTLLLHDEIQSGGGRTGSFLASQTLAGGGASLGADIVTLAKAIGAGIPIGATVCRREIGELLVPGTHGSTFAGGALACRAALVFLSELYEHGLLERVRALGAKLRQGLDALAAKHACVATVRGIGLMQALVLRVPSPPLAAALLARGLIVNATAGTVLRFLPPFVLSDDELAEGLTLLDEVLAEHDAHVAHDAKGSPR